MGPMPPVPPQQQAVYDAPNCDYDPPSYMEQNFGNPYDCPENMYNGSMMSSVGYSQVSEQPLPQQPKSSKIDNFYGFITSFFAKWNKNVEHGDWEKNESKIPLSFLQKKYFWFFFQGKYKIGSN